MIYGRGPMRTAVFRRPVELDARPPSMPLILPLPPRPGGRSIRRFSSEAKMEFRAVGKRSYDGHLSIAVGPLTFSESRAEGGRAVDPAKVEEGVARSGHTIASAIRRRAWWRYKEGTAASTAHRPRGGRWPTPAILGRSKRCVWFVDETHADYEIADYRIANRGDLADWILVCLDEWLEAGT